MKYLVLLSIRQQLMIDSFARLFYVSFFSIIIIIIVCFLFVDCGTSSCHQYIIYFNYILLCNRTEPFQRKREKKEEEDERDRERNDLNHFLIIPANEPCDSFSTTNNLHRTQLNVKVKVIFNDINKT